MSDTTKGLNSSGSLGLLRAKLMLGRRDFNTAEIQIENIETSKNIRKVEKDDNYRKVRDSIAKIGLINPVIVMKNFSQADKDYLCIGGHTRLMAMQELGYLTAPCTILPESDLTQARFYALVDNIARNDLNAIEKSEAFLYAKRDLNLTTTGLANKVGCSRQYATCILNIATWPSDVKQECIDNSYTLKALFKFARKKMSDNEAREKIATLRAPIRQETDHEVPVEVADFAKSKGLDKPMVKTLVTLNTLVDKLGPDKTMLLIAFLNTKILMA